MPRWLEWPGRTPRGARWHWWCGSSRRWHRARPAASAWWRRCPGTRSGARAPAAAAVGSRRGSGGRRALRPRPPFSPPPAPDAVGQAGADHPIELFPHPDVLHAAEDLGGEAVCQHPRRRFALEAAAAEVVERRFVERADGGAVRALHVVGVDLELGLAVGPGLGREQQIVVGLLGVGALRARPHDDSAVEDAVRLLAQQAVEVFVARAV